MNEQMNKLISEKKSKEYEKGIEKVAHLITMGYSGQTVQKAEDFTKICLRDYSDQELNRTKEALKVLREGLLNIKLDDLLVSIVRPIDRIIKKSDKILKEKI